MKTLLRNFLCFAFLCFVSAEIDMQSLTNASLSGFESNQVFFKAGEDVHVLCNDFQEEEVCESGEFRKLVAKQSKGKFSAECKGHRQIIESIIIQTDEDGNPTYLSVYCCTLTGNFSVSSSPDADSSDEENKVMDCGFQHAMKKIKLEFPDGESQSTKATASCVELNLIDPE